MQILSATSYSNRPNMTLEMWHIIIHTRTRLALLSDKFDIAPHSLSIHHTICNNRKVLHSGSKNLRRLGWFLQAQHLLNVLPSPFIKGRKARKRKKEKLLIFCMSKMHWMGPTHHNYLSPILNIWAGLMRCHSFSTDEDLQNGTSSINIGLPKK